MNNYFIAKNGQQTGPFAEAEVLQQMAAGAVGPQDLCWHEGMTNWAPISSVIGGVPPPPAAPPLLAPPVPAPATPPLFLHISITRLVLMSILSFSLYEAYWIYKNWRFVKERDHLNIRPFWRGFFAIFYCHSLLRRIHADPEANALQTPLFSPGGLATGWVVLIILANAVSRAPSIVASIVAAFIPSFLCLVPVQKYINAVTDRRNPGQRFHEWSAGHVLCLVFGIIIWVLFLSELFG